MIRSADVNADLNDIGLGLTQSLATTGVSSMTGPIKAAAGALGAPSYSFVSALHTGFYLAGADQIGWSSNSILGATFNSDLTVTWFGGATWAGDIGTTGNLAVTGALNVISSASFSSNVNINSNLKVVGYQDMRKQAADPTFPAANFLRFYVKPDGFAAGSRPYAQDEVGNIFPLMFTGGQCQLTKSGANLLLSPYQGNRLTIAGVPQIVPDAGITLAASNTAGVFVYIYAFVTAGTMTLEMSQTVPILQSGTGVKQKTGDSSRTLVGAAYTDTGGAWADTDGKLWVLSYFNRRRKASKLTIVTSVTNASATYIEVDTALRNNFIQWSDEVLFIHSKLQASSSSATINAQFANQHNLDGITPIDSEIQSLQPSGVLSFIPNYSKLSGITENTTHYISIYFKSFNGSVGTCGTPGASGNSSGEGTALYVDVNG